MDQGAPVVSCDVALVDGAASVDVLLGSFGFRRAHYRPEKETRDVNTGCSNCEAGKSVSTLVIARKDDDVERISEISRSVVASYFEQWRKNGGNRSDQPTSY